MPLFPDLQLHIDGFSNTRMNQVRIEVFRSWLSLRDPYVKVLRPEIDAESIMRKVASQSLSLKNKARMVRQTYV